MQSKMHVLEGKRQFLQYHHQNMGGPSAGEIFQSKKRASHIDVLVVNQVNRHNFLRQLEFTVSLSAGAFAVFCRCTVSCHCRHFARKREYKSYAI